MNNKKKNYRQIMNNTQSHVCNKVFKIKEPLEKNASFHFSSVTFKPPNCIHFSLFMYCQRLLCEDCWSIADKIDDDSPTGLISYFKERNTDHF